MTRQEIYTRLLLSFGLLALSIWYAIKAQSFSRLAEYAPTFASCGLGAILCIAIGRDIVRLVKLQQGSAQTFSRSVEHTSEDPLDWRELRHAARYALWFVALVAAIHWLGMYITAPAFAGIFLLVEARIAWYKAALGAAVVLLLMWFFKTYVELAWPKGAWTGV